MVAGDVKTKLIWSFGNEYVADVADWAGVEMKQFVAEECVNAPKLHLTHLEQ